MAKNEADADAIETASVEAVELSPNAGAATIECPGPIPADALLSEDRSVRFFADRLKESVASARAAGYVVDLPFQLDALDRIAISETAKVAG